MESIERMAEGGFDLMKSKIPAWRRVTIDDLQRRRQMDTTDPHHLTERFVKRAYQTLWDKVRPR